MAYFIFLWGYLGALYWILSVIESGELDFGTLVFGLPLCVLIGPMIALHKLDYEPFLKVILWRKK
jgi:hypothetical protein